MTAPIVLAKGSHAIDEEDDCGNPQRCLFEWYNWLTRQESTDSRPPGVSPVLHQFGMSLNDVLPDVKRQDLVRFLPNGTDRLAGTARDGLDEARGYLILDWLVRAYLPGWLDLAGISSELAAHPRIDSLESARSAGVLVRDAAVKADAAWAAARDAAGDADWDADWSAARDAAWSAAWDAAWSAAGDAARDAAGDADWDAAGDAARDAARSAAGSAAGDAAWAAARAAAGDADWYAARDAAWSAARDAAWSAAWARLAPTVASLQDSAISLYDRMIDGRWS